MADLAHAVPPPPVTTSVPPEIPAEQEALFREVLSVLEKAGLPYAISGAFALQLHTGIFRFTKDLDIFLTAENASRALAELAQHGFSCEVTDPVWLAKAFRDDFFVDLISGMSNAALVVEDSWIKRAHPTVVYGVPSRILAPEELLASKLFVTRRERFDGADIAHVIYGTQGKMDWDRVLELIGEHWEILFWALVLFHYVYPSKTHYVPRSLWKELVTRFTSAISEASPGAQFRGSLVDENMFAIDVKEWGLANVLEEYRKRRSAHIQPCPPRAGRRKPRPAAS